MSADLKQRLRGGTMGFDWSDLPDDALIPAVPLLREAAAHIESLETRAGTATPKYQVTAVMNGTRTRLVVSDGDDAYSTADRAAAERVLAEVQKLPTAYRDARIEPLLKQGTGETE